MMPCLHPLTFYYTSAILLTVIGGPVCDCCTLFLMAWSMIAMMKYALHVTWPVIAVPSLFLVTWSMFAMMEYALHVALSVIAVPLLFLVAWSVIAVPLHFFVAWSVIATLKYALHASWLHWTIRFMWPGP